jgi:hypothetical protein
MSHIFPAEEIMAETPYPESRLTPPPEDYRWALFLLHQDLRNLHREMRRDVQDLRDDVRRLRDGRPRQSRYSSRDTIGILRSCHTRSEYIYRRDDIDTVHASFDRLQRRIDVCTAKLMVTMFIWAGVILAALKF